VFLVIQPEVRVFVHIISLSVATLIGAGRWLTLAAASEAVALTTGGELAQFVLACVGCGLLGALVMDYPMSRQEEGFTPAYVAAALVRRVPVAEVSVAEALVVHHATGAVAGVLYALVYLLFARVVPDVVAVGGVVAVGHLAATMVVSGFVYAFFAHVVLPRTGRGIYEERSTAVRGQWLRSVIVFGVVLGLFVPVFTTLV